MFISYGVQAGGSIVNATRTNTTASAPTVSQTDYAPYVEQLKQAQRNKKVRDLQNAYQKFVESEQTNADGENKKFAPNVRVSNVKSTEPIFNNEQQNTNAEISGKAQQINVVDYLDREGVLRQLQKGEEETANLSYEVNYSVTKDGKVWKIAGESGMVDLSPIINDLRGAYSYHNHPSEKTHYSFSGEDVAFFINAGEDYSKASDDSYEYMMWRTEETIEKSYDEVYHRFKEILQKDVYALAWDGLIDIDIDGYHETMKRLSKELRFGYERRKKDSN